MESMDTGFLQQQQVNYGASTSSQSVPWNDYMEFDNDDEEDFEEEPKMPVLCYPDSYEDQATEEPPTIDEEPIIAEEPTIEEDTNEIYQGVYRYQVRRMMYLFGDAENPLDTSVTLVNSLLESQMDILIEKCENVMKFRGAQIISHKDVLFLMRRNKVLLKRLLQFLRDQDIDNNPESLDSEVNKFLGSIEKFTGDLTRLSDDKMIIDRIAEQRLKRKKFLQNEVSEISLNRLCPEIFKGWLCNCRLRYPVDQYPFDITLLAISIIDFLAIETVAGLVEKALHMRSRACEIKENRSLLSDKIFKNQIKLFEDAEDAEPENKFADHQDLSLAALPKVALYSKNSEQRKKIHQRTRKIRKRMRNLPIIIPVKMKSKLDLIQRKPITTDEIVNAFIHYQRHKPMSLWIKTSIPFAEKRKVNLVCLAFADEEYSEL